MRFHHFWVTTSNIDDDNDLRWMNEVDGKKSTKYKKSRIKIDKMEFTLNLMLPVSEWNSKK